MKTNKISFNELYKFNDSNSVVMMATIFPKDFDFEIVNDDLSEVGFSKGKKLTGVHFITGNVKGGNGRKDWLLEFDNEDVPFNPMARLQIPDLKWTSDFVSNHQKDYK